MDEPRLQSLVDGEMDPLNLEIMENQATINIGTIGHVAHGKSTVVKAISGVQTVRFKNELERNITIKLGYANAKIYKCTSDDCAPPGCYMSCKSSIMGTPRCGNLRAVNGEMVQCGEAMKLVRHVSFVDCPGHDILMATMLNGAAVMDAALLLIAANEPCPQPQTAEHLAAIEIMKLNNIIILQNKIDLVKEQVAEGQYASIKKFIAGTVAERAPIIPTSGQLKYNIDAICEHIVKNIAVPKRNFKADPQMIVIRSFDVNKPGTDPDELEGGVAGGCILFGVLKVGDEIEIRPGIIKTGQKLSCRPLYSKVVSLRAEGNNLSFAVPGGLIGVGTNIDPYNCRADRLVGQVIGLRGKLPAVYSEIEIRYFLLRRLLGVKMGVEKAGMVKKIEKGETLMINVGSKTAGCCILSVKADIAKISLNSPVCTEIGEKIALSRRISHYWRLIGWGEICSGTKILT